MNAPVKLLVINPNSTESITDGLREILVTPPEAELFFMTAPPDAPTSIDDITTGNLTASSCFRKIMAEDLINKYDGFLVCCFSNHPLTHMLRETTSKPVIGILEAAITRALLVGNRFGIVTSGSGYKYHSHAEISTVLGGKSDKFAGIAFSGIGVVELREGDRVKVEKSVKESAAKIAAEGADVILLGCAGMAGMEELVKQGVREGQPTLPIPKVIDGAKSGVEFLASLVRLDRQP
ncbi:Asp/Glu/hydantoin racemase [Flagelloscypha sp. PMI_526]|nr:Asp/Glu/hydantoin racemase [Flagelloscypha sp. PMI_526]